MTGYKERADRFASSRLVGKIYWKRRNSNTYIYLGDVIIVENGKSQGLQRAILLVAFDDKATMKYSLTPHERATEIFMAANFTVNH